MMLTELTAAIGVPPKWKQEIWPLFESHTLGLISDACQALIRSKQQRNHWKERHFSLALYFHLDRICRERDLPFSPREEQGLLTEEELFAGRDPKKAPRIDLLIRYHNLDDPTIFFGLEAKVLVGRTVGAYTPAGTVREYVDEGMSRYVSKQYAEGLPVGTMLGYLLAGEAGDLARRINSRIETLPLPCKSPLTHKKKPHVLEGHYESVHPRFSASDIRIHHLFVVMGSLEDLSPREE